VGITGVSPTVVPSFGSKGFSLSQLSYSVKLTSSMSSRKAGYCSMLSWNL
jgi:hypothetical protein